MKQELDDLLCERYPLIFAKRHDSKRDTCMCWGFSCGDGWFTLIDTLCKRLQFDTDHNDLPQVVATQVKEKFGELRFYIESGTERQFGMIDLAASMSAHLCEECGSPGTLLNNRGYYMTRCAEHTPPEAVPRDGKTKEVGR
ncbi:MAG TPA: hypothetical protein PLW86_03900 [Rhodocyclaceae bacterium]|nr:hypothetical protein [Rhodocyclaceae bacterium]